jgi:hypothetical protein
MLASIMKFLSPGGNKKEEQRDEERLLDGMNSGSAESSGTFAIVAKNDGSDAHFVVQNTNNLLAVPLTTSEMGKIVESLESLISLRRQNGLGDEE